MDDGLRQTIERVRQQNAHVLPVTNMVQHVPSDIQRLIAAAERVEAAEYERERAMARLGEEVLECTLIHQRLDAVAVDAMTARIRVGELEAQLRGLLPVAQTTVSKIEFFPPNNQEE